MGADPIVYCLENLTDYSQFERLCNELMAREGYRAIEPLGGLHDKGRDAIYINRADQAVAIFCYSVREDWFAKLKQDARTIRQHGHACDRLVYLSTYNFSTKERDAAIQFIKETYGWELELYGLERLRLLLATDHGELIANHPQIFHPSFFEAQSPGVEAQKIRSLIDRLIAANEKYMESHLRLVAWPYKRDVPKEQLLGKHGTVTVAVPTADCDVPAQIGVDVVFSKAAMQDCTNYDFWGVAGVNSGQDGQETRMLFLIWGGAKADAAASEFGALAAESGRLYQGLPPHLAPIHGTTSPRNLWATVLYGWLRQTSWVLKSEGFESIGVPFAASAELWRRLLYGTTADGRVESTPSLSEGAQRLLLAATSAKRQTITMNSNMRGFNLGTGDGPIVETEDARQIAECRSWVEELLQQELISDHWHKGEVFAVTKKGYAAADDLRG